MGQLHNAVKKQDKTLFIKLETEKGIEYVRNCVFINVIRDPHMNTILHIACDNGFMHAVDASLRIHVDLNSSNVAGDTALILAVKRGRLDLVKRVPRLI
jgi:ankyrin repeat protein